eukprot:TRINITY_DN36437_c0_g1_i1.p1 TRINITY_DN36437_c0_g1~~TRINITY_DN36437_c0_g1_i1.p1  ORF type:complete len:262 (+),score=89.51 TRINITY_DN36437_c0_g1_i1:64-786(+)
MALNRTDTRQRAYNRIDTSQPQGNWIEEASYNRRGGKVLVGNWVEERVLGDSMRQHGTDGAVHKVEEQTSRFGAARAKGGFSSSQFLVNPRDEPEHWALGGAKPHFLSVNQSEYRHDSADAAKMKPAEVGVARRRRAAEVVADAVASEERPEVSRTYYSTSYQSATASAKLPSPKGPRDSFDYAEDVPVSLYTGNPSTGKKMAVQGKSAGTGRNPFAKNAAFSTPIDRHPTGGKHQTPEY